jgi:serine beta-lactamase-like protein LACTB, mitochondrial
MSMHPSRRPVRLAVFAPAGLIVLAALAAPPCAKARASVTPDSAAERRHAEAVPLARRLVRAHMEHLAIPGMQVAVAVDGRIVWSEGFGYSDLETRTPVTPLTRFRIGSISKTLTAAGLGLLLQDGRIELDAPVRRYVPEWVDRGGRPITIRHLAAHQSGIRHYTSNADADRTEHYATVADALSIFLTDTLLFEPGTRYGYSSYGYTLLSAAMESAAEESFLSFMRRRVFVPMGMTGTVADHVDSVVPWRARFYVAGERGERLPVQYLDNSYKWAAGGFLSTAEDLVRFAQAHLAGTLLADSIVELLFTPQRLQSGEVTRAGIGWEPRSDRDGRQVVTYTGQQPGMRAVLALYPGERLAIAVLTNTGNSVFWNEEETLALASLFLPPAGSEGTPDENVDVAGLYSFETILDGKPASGLLQLYGRGAAYRGLLTLPGLAPGPVPVARVHGNEVWGVAILGNWMEMRLSFDGGRFTGSWAFGPETGGFTDVTRLR